MYVLNTTQIVMPVRQRRERFWGTILCSPTRFGSGPSRGAKWLALKTKGRTVSRPCYEPPVLNNAPWYIDIGMSPVGHWCLESSPRSILTQNRPLALTYRPHLALWVWNLYKILVNKLMSNGTQWEYGKDRAVILGRSVMRRLGTNAASLPHFSLPQLSKI